jgi:hypothetical protein
LNTNSWTFFFTGLRRNNCRREASPGWVGLARRRVPENLIARGRTCNAFQMRICRPFALFLLVLLLCGFARAQSLATPPVVTIDGLGKGTVDLSEPWRFHVGDDMQWAGPSIRRHSGSRRLGDYSSRSAVGGAKPRRVYRLCLVPAAPSHHTGTRRQNRLSIAPAPPARCLRGVLERQTCGPLWKAASATVLAGFECARSLHLAGFSIRHPRHPCLERKAWLRFGR